METRVEGGAGTGRRDCGKHIGKGLGRHREPEHVEDEADAEQGDEQSWLDNMLPFAS